MRQFLHKWVIPLLTLAFAALSFLWPRIDDWRESNRPLVELESALPMIQVWYESPGVSHSYIAVDIRNISNRDLMLYSVGIAENGEDCGFAVMSPLPIQNSGGYYPRYYPGVRDTMPYRLLPGERTAYKGFGVVLILSDNQRFSFENITDVCVQLDRPDNVIKLPTDVYDEDVVRLIGPLEMIMRAYE